MIKLFTTEMCSRVYERCMQVHGGMGLTNETKLYDGWHQARLARIADDVSPELARATIKSVEVLGAFHANAAVRSALADRML